MKEDRSSADFYLFVRLAFQHLSGRQLDTSQTYIRYICYELFGFIQGRKAKLLVNLPGRHLKTSICSVFLSAYMLGLNPKLKILIVAYDETIAEDIVKDIRKVMESPIYKLFFKTKIDVNHNRKRDFEIVGGGRVRAVPIRSVTGKGGDIVLLDDPHNSVEWNNDRVKRITIQHFNNLMTRRNAGSKSQILVVGHRVAADDLSAHIEERGDFDIIRLPLFAPFDMEFSMGAEGTWHFLKNSALRPDEFPREEIDNRIRESLGGPSFWLHHQQGIGSNDVDTDVILKHFPFFKGQTSGMPVVLSVDPTAKTSSSSRNVVHAYAVCGDKYVLVDAFAERCSFDRLLKTVEQFARCYKAALIIIEETGRGGDLIDALRPRVGAKVEGIIPRGTKLSRFGELVPLIRRKKVQIVQSSGEVESAIDEIIAFPRSEFDDHVDALVNFLERMGRLAKEPLPAAVTRDRMAIGIALGSSLASLSTGHVRGIGVALRSGRK